MRDMALCSGAVGAFVFRSLEPPSGGRDSSVGIVTRLRAGRSGVRIPAGARYFSLFPENVEAGCGAHPVSCFQWVLGGFPGGKAPGA